MHEALFAASTRFIKTRRAWPHRRADARARAPPHQASPRRARRSMPTRSNASRTIVERLAALGTAFSQNVLADEQSYTMELDGEADLAGLPDFVRGAAAAAAEGAAMKGKHRHHPAALQRRAVPATLVAARSPREKAFRAWIARGDKRRQDRQRRRSSPRPWRCGPSAPDCSAIRRSRITGSTTPWAKTPEAVRGLLEKVWKPARKAALGRP